MPSRALRIVHSIKLAARSQGYLHSLSLLAHGVKVLGSTAPLVATSHCDRFNAETDAILRASFYFKHYLIYKAITDGRGHGFQSELQTLGKSSALTVKLLNGSSRPSYESPQDLPKSPIVKKLRYRPFQG